MKRFKVGFLLLLLTAATSLKAQNLEQYWFFGNATSKGLQFAKPNFQATLINKPSIIPYGIGGGAVACDIVSGELMFYTDGTKVFNRNHGVMATGLNGLNSRNQAAAICKMPGSTSQYYIFTNSIAGTIEYSVVDMSLGGVFPLPGDGMVTSTNNTIAGLPAGMSEAMIVVANANGTDFWLITHDTGGQFFVSSITSLGVTAGLPAAAGLINTPSNFAYRRQDNLLAVAPAEPNKNIEIFQFDNAAGTLTLSQTVQNSLFSTAAGTNPVIYDTEWSKDGQYLYASVVGNSPTYNADVLQFDLTGLLTDPTLLPTTILTVPEDQSFGLQMGLDSTIYHLYRKGANFIVGRITDTDSIATKVIYDPAAYSGVASFNAKQFPSFIPKYKVLVPPTFEAKGLCLNLPTAFFPTVSPGADSVKWFFGDGTSASGWSPTYTYQSASTFSVTLRAYLNGDSIDSAPQPVTIQNFTTTISVTSDTTACSDELPYPRGWKVNGTQGCTTCFTLTAQVNGGGNSEWFGPSGDIGPGPILKPDSAGYYYITSVDAATGCVAYSGVTIHEYGVQSSVSSIWHFGDHGGLDFNPPNYIPPGPIKPINGPLNTPEGSAVIGDANGEIVISTDGQSVFDRTGTDITPIPNPPGLGGETGSTQSSLIVQAPNNKYLYYIFTTKDVDNGIFELRYSLFDLRGDATHLNGVITESNILLFNNCTERITTDPSGTWLITHEFGNNNFRAYNLAINGNDGIDNPVISNAGSVHSFADANYAKGYMKFDGGAKLAVPLAPDNVIEIFDFDNGTGIISNPKRVPVAGAGTIYGIEFDNNKMFVTLTGNPSQFAEFYIHYDGTFEQLTTPVIPPTPEELGAIQKGPDNQIYFAIKDADHLGKITVNPDSTKTSTYDYQTGQPLFAGTHSLLGLPNVKPNNNGTGGAPSFAANGNCLGSETEFFGSGSGSIDTLYYYFDDGTTEVRLNDDKSKVARTFKTPGVHTATLIVRNRCVGQVAKLVINFTIYPPPADPSGSFVLCQSTLVLDANPSNAADMAYGWSTTDSVRTITVMRTGLYLVTVKDTITGCSTNARMVVTPGTAPIDIIDGSSVCAVAGTSVTLNTGISLPNHVWTKNGTVVGNSSDSFVVDFSSPANSGKYKVVFTNPNNGCISADSATFVINPLPTFTTTVGPPASCTAGGSINATITGPSAQHSYSYAVVPGSSGAIPFNTSTPVATNVGTGNYNVTISDVTTGCPTNSVVSVNMAGPPAVTINPAAIVCNPVNIQFSSTTNGTYRIIDNLTGLQTESGNYTTTPAFKVSTNTYAPGTYVVEVTSGVCKNSSSITIAPGSGTPLDVTIDKSTICTDQTVRAVVTNSNSALTYAWKDVDSGTAIGTNSANLVLTPRPAPWNIQVTVSNATECTNNATETADLSVPAVDFTSNKCTSPIHLNATPKGATYLYSWKFNGTSIPGNDAIDVTATGTYEITIQSFTGCQVSISHPVDPAALAPLTVTIDPVFPCSGQPFDLTAVTDVSRVTSYTWKRNNTVLPTTTNPLTGNTQAGTYSVTVANANCDATTSLALTKFRDPTPAGLNPTEEICPEGGESIVLNPDPDNTRGFVSFTWTLDGVAPANNQDPTFEATVPGTYKVALINSLFCPSEGQTIVVEECNPDLNAPKAFKPSSSIAENTDFYVFPHFVDAQGFQMFIYNRWGEMVYSSSDLEFKWNGTFNNIGAVLPPGTYSWVAKFKSKYRPQDGIKTKHGGVVLLR